MDGRIIAAGGAYVINIPHDDPVGPDDWIDRMDSTQHLQRHSGMEILDPLSGMWSSLPNMMHDEQGYGITLSSGNFGVLSKSFLDCFDSSDGTWQRLEGAGMDEISSVVRVSAHVILAVGDKYSKAYDERFKRWVTVPFWQRSPPC